MGELMEVFSFKPGNSPVMVSIPHSGEYLPGDLSRRMTAAGNALVDTDWYIPRLYDFLGDLGASVLQANYSRYVVDLNRAADGVALYPGQRETGVCPTTTFMDQEIYTPRQAPSEHEVSQRKLEYWDPYHQKLQVELEKIKHKFGYALLWDAHSMQSQLPRFFEGSLPDLNMGTAEGASCDQKLSDELYEILKESSFNVVRNGRFKGGHITRHYGEPDQGVHTVQMEIAQIAYMTEYPNFVFDEDKANKLRPVLMQTIEAMTTAFAYSNFKGV